MKTGLKVAAAMMVIMSGTVIAAPFSVSSADMRDGQTLAQTHWFGGFGCTGGNISPQIAWKNAPAGTRSFAVTAYDPDAPTGSGWWHWTVVNIAQQVTGLAAGAGDVVYVAKRPAGGTGGAQRRAAAPSGDGIAAGAVSGWLRRAAAQRAARGHNRSGQANYYAVAC